MLGVACQLLLQFMSWLLQDLWGRSRGKHLEKREPHWPVQGALPRGVGSPSPTAYVYILGIVCNAFSSDPGWSPPARGWDECPQLLGHLADTSPSVQAFLHSVASLSRIPPPKKSISSSRSISPLGPHFGSLSANTSWARGTTMTLEPCPSPGGLAPPAQGGRQSHRGPSLGQGGRHACTMSCVCAHTGSVCASRAHCWPDSHRTGSRHPVS